MPRPPLLALLGSFGELDPHHHHHSPSPPSLRVRLAHLSMHSTHTTGGTDAANQRASIAAAQRQLSPRCVPSSNFVAATLHKAKQALISRTGALVLAHSLRDAGTTKKLAVLVTLDSVSAEVITQLKARHVPKPPPPAPAHATMLAERPLIRALRRLSSTT